MKKFPLNKFWVFMLSTPIFSSSIYAEAVVSDSQLATITIEATTVEGNLTEDTKAYKKNSSTQATKMNLALKETPQTISVITQQQMQDQGLNNIAEVMQQVPGVSLGYNDSERPNYNVRGSAVDNIQIDGISSSYSGVSGSVLAMPVFDMAIYDHVEVLKGANGLNTGLGEPSAAINMVHKQPTQDFKAQVSASYDTFDGRKYVGDISGAVLNDEKLNVRVIAALTEGGTAKDAYDRDSKTFSGIAVSNLTAQTKLTVGIDYQDDNPQGIGGGVPVFYSDGSKTDFSAENNFGTMDWVRWQRELLNSYIYLDHKINQKWQAKLSLSRQDLDAFAKTSYPYNGYLNPNGSGLTYSAWASEGDLDQYTYDLTVTGLFDLWGREHQVVFGANGWDRTANEYGLSYPTYSANNIIADIEDFYGNHSPDFEPERTGKDKKTQSKTLGTFLNTRWNIHDEFKLFAGARLSNWETQTNNYSNGVLINTTSEQKQRDIVVPYVAATYELFPNTTLYTSYTEIFKPQSYLDVNDDFLEPITGSNTEIGIKNSFFDQQLDLNTAFYWAKKDNVAELIAGTGVNGIESRYRGVKGAETKGFEVETVGKLNDFWNIALGYAYNKTKDAKGKEINTENPNHMAKLNTSFQFNGELSGLSVGGSLNWYGSSYAYIDMQPLNSKLKATQEDYFVVGLFGAYHINDQTRIALNIHNLFDEQYYTRINSNYKTGYIGDGRSAVISMNYTF